MASSEPIKADAEAARLVSLAAVRGRIEARSVTEHQFQPEGSSASRRAPLYGPYYGLVESPFDLTPNPRFLFLTARQREALGNLRYGLASAKGLTVILGDAGTGKTTLIRTALSEVGETASRYVLVSNPTLGRTEFYQFLAREFGLSQEARDSKATFLSELQQQVETRAIAGGVTGLIIDEAQSLPFDLLEEIRLLGNIETPTTKLLNIILSGQPELAARLNDPSLRQLKQRIALRCELHPLTLAETANYVSGRLRIAGGSPAEIFTREAVITIHEAAAGIPRTVNVLCDNALINGFAAQLKPIPARIAEDVCRDFDVDGKATTETRGEPPAAAVQGPGALSPAAPVKPAEERPMFGSVANLPKRRFKFF